MKVKDLIEQLGKQNPDAPVWLNVAACFGDGGCCMTAEGPLDELDVSGGGMVYLSAYQDKPRECETVAGSDPAVVVSKTEWRPPAQSEKGGP